MKKIFTYLLSFLALASHGQSIQLQLSPEKDCNDRTYCVDIQVSKSNLVGLDLAVGTSSILLTYDEAVLVFREYLPENFHAAGSCAGWLPQRYDAISRRGELEITMVLAQNGNTCPVIGNDPMAVGTVCFDIVQQGASPNIRFDLGHTQFNTNDLNNGATIVAISGAGYIDEKNLLACDCAGTGEPCDDQNIYTVNDRFDVFCHCRGQYLDSDQDGILDGVDACLDQIYEAEAATLNEVAVQNNQPRYSGTGFVDYLHNTGDFIEFSVDVQTEGMHQLGFRYALETGNRPLDLAIDGSLVVPALGFPATGAWANWDTIMVSYFLTKGDHTIRLTTIGQNGANVDQLILSVCSGCAETGLSCDDGNPCTQDDVIGADCNCGGRYEDSDFDGVCNVEDQCEGHNDLADTDADGIPDGCDNCDNALIGTPCDDGDPCTENDKYVADCQCIGTFNGPDADGDGVCDAFDICPAGNDAFDADGDGVPDACDLCDNRSIGSPCDDGNPCTLLDVVTANCGCSGFFYDSDGDGVCSALDQCEGFDDSIDNDGDGQPDACDVSIAISPKMEIGKAVGVNDDWQTVNLENTYQSMVVVATVVLPDNDRQPVVTRIRNAVGDKFELRVQNPGEQVKGDYSVQYVVAEEGIYTEAEHGMRMEARKELSVETADATNYIREQRAYLQPYSRPAIVGQVMTFNDSRWSVFWSSRHNSSSIPADTTGFAAGKMVAEDTITQRLNETIGFLVFESGIYSRDGVRFEARLGENSILGTGNSTTGYTYQLDLEMPNHAVLSTSGVNGGNGGWPVLFGNQLFRGNAMYLAFDEDQILDSERTHIEEEVSYLAFEFVKPFALAGVSTVPVSCFGEADGSANVVVTGGESPYQYLWSNGATTAQVDGLTAGAYTCTITDSNGTEEVASAIINQPAEIDFNLSGSAISCFGSNDGYALVLSFGGTGQHTYQWNTGEISPEITDLPSGNYTVTMTDANGCTETGSYEVLEPAARPTTLLVLGEIMDRYKYP